LLAQLLFKVIINKNNGFWFFQIIRHGTKRKTQFFNQLREIFGRKLGLSFV
jgi:hypothetical protein